MAMHKKKQCNSNHKVIFCQLINKEGIINSNQKVNMLVKK